MLPRSQIVPKILLFAKTFQKGRGTQNVPNGTKNEREVNPFTKSAKDSNFCEGVPKWACANDWHKCAKK